MCSVAQEMLFAGDGTGNDSEGKKENEKAQTQLK
jgi:hypothetical protein